MTPQPPTPPEGYQLHQFKTRDVLPDDYYFWFRMMTCWQKGGARGTYLIWDGIHYAVPADQSGDANKGPFVVEKMPASAVEVTEGDCQASKNTGSPYCTPELMASFRTAPKSHHEFYKKIRSSSNVWKDIAEFESTSVEAAVREKELEVGLLHGKIRFWENQSTHHEHLKNQVAKECDDLRAQLAAKSAEVDECRQILHVNSQELDDLAKNALPPNHVAVPLDELIELFDALINVHTQCGKWIEKETLNESAKDGTQQLSRMLAELLDKHASKISALRPASPTEKKEDK